jgi:hypothetical protein
MRTLLAMAIAFAMLNQSIGSQYLDVGGDFGLSWLAKYGHTVATNNTNNTDNLWDWGGKPKGYEVFNGTLYPFTDQTVWFYPAFMSNELPVIINGTALRYSRNMPADLLSPYYTSDPWLLAQFLERPVAVAYAGNSSGSSLY